MTTTIDTPRLLAKEQATIDADLSRCPESIQTAYLQLRELRESERRMFLNRIAQLEQMLTANLTN